jgi:hypothetical protein
VDIKTKNKLEILWQDFEKSGSIESYLSYRQIKLSSAKSKPKEIKVKAAAKQAKAGKSSR